MKILTIARYDLIFAILGPLVYVAICLMKRRQIVLGHALECMLNGAGVPAGIFLMVCSFVPSWLVKIAMPAGKACQDLSSLTIDIDQEKSLCILVGGFAILFLSIANLSTIYSGQKHALPKARSRSK